MTIQLVRDQTPNPEEKRSFRKALTITLAGNLVLAAGKAYASYITGSVALYADAANSVSDVLYSLLMILGLWLAMQPPDISHPQGHSRFEPLVGLAIAGSMTLAGYEAGRTAIERFINGGAAIDPGLPTIVLILSAAVKVGMFFAIRRIARELRNATLETVAKDNFNDVLASGGVFLGALGSSLINPLLDPIAGGLVALLIFKSAFVAAKENLSFLTGAGASEEMRQQIIETARAVPGVEDVHHVMTEHVGPKLVVDLHINVDGSLPLIESHKINDTVIEAIEALPDVDRAYVHLEPDGWKD
ncbi:MAG: cation diffusion facilitator family transporter [Anaerolineaceae bacterium]|jgi:cation diffusion facilitator family transporter|nr:cation diffusion facilitator family transporter [Anaerolineaceae bacterium]